MAPDDERSEIMESHMSNRTPVVVAEIGCVHGGAMDRAHELIELAAAAGANIAKFQKRNPIECVSKATQDQPHPNPKFAWGGTYLEHRQNLELAIEQHAELKQYCESLGMKYSTSVWDTTSTREVIELNPDCIKVPSACNNNLEILELLTKQYHGDIHISLGMSTSSDYHKIRAYLFPYRERVIVYHCTSIYPCPSGKLYLNEIPKLLEWKTKSVGFSNHGLGIHADIAAFAMGANYIERHFVDRKSFPHTDAAASLVADEMRSLCVSLEDIAKALTGRPAVLDAEEQIQCNKLRNTGRVL